MRREEVGSEKIRPWWLEAMTPGATLAKDLPSHTARGLRISMSDQVIRRPRMLLLTRLRLSVEKHRIKRVPILKDGKLVGIVSRSNLVQALRFGQT